MNFEPVLKGAAAVVSFFRNVFWETWGVQVPISCQEPTNLWWASRPKAKHRGGDCGIEWILLLCCQSYKVILSFCRSEEDSAFERHRSLINVGSWLNFRHFNTNSKKFFVTVNFIQKVTKTAPKSSVLLFSISRSFRPLSDDSRSFRKISEDSRRFPKTIEDVRRLPKVSED